MGDVAMTVPVLRVLTATYPTLKITVVSRGFFKPLFEGIPNTNFLEADVYGVHKGFGLFKLANEAKALGIDAVADLHNVIRSKIVTKALRFKGIKNTAVDKGREEKKALLNAGGKPIIPLKSMFERYADVFRKMGFPIDLNEHAFPPRQQLNIRLHNLIGSEPKKCIGIAPFAAYEGKMFPLELMKKVLTEIDGTQNYKVLLFGGGKEEIKVLNEMALQFTSVTNIAGSLTFEEELALISNLDLMVAMDSGNGHLAAMYGVPVLTMWGVTHPFAGFKPFGQPDEHQLLSNREAFPLIPTSVYGNKQPKGYEKVMGTISPDLVLNKIFKLL